MTPDAPFSTFGIRATFCHRAEPAREAHSMSACPGRLHFINNPPDKRTMNEHLSLSSRIVLVPRRAGLCAGRDKAKHDGYQKFWLEEGTHI